MLISEVLSLNESRELELDCLVEYREADAATGIEYRDCVIDHTACPNRNCIKKLV